MFLWLNMKRKSLDSKICAIQTITDLLVVISIESVLNQSVHTKIHMSRDYFKKLSKTSVIEFGKNKFYL